MSGLIDTLFALQDSTYRDFQSKLIPTVDYESIIGVRTPELRRLAKTPDGKALIVTLPHKYFEENQIHAFVISDLKDFDQCISELYRFLPFVDNWATCDQMSPKAFSKNHNRLTPHIDRWLASDETYTVRFAIKTMMDCFLSEDFDIEYPEKAAGIHSDEYYINMMIAWYFATALAKQYDAVIPFIENRRLDIWTHNKTIQKAVESNRISPEKKEILRAMRLK